MFSNLVSVHPKLFSNLRFWVLKPLAFTKLHTTLLWNVMSIFVKIFTVTLSFLGKLILYINSRVMYPLFLIESYIFKFCRGTTMYAGIADRMQKEITALAPSSKFLMYWFKNVIHLMMYLFLSKINNFTNSI